MTGEDVTVVLGPLDEVTFPTSAPICLNTITPADPALPGFRLVTTPTAVQRQAFDLLGVSHRLGAA